MTYSSEVWSGIEYQVAGHALMEGLIEEGLLITYSVWDRYNNGDKYGRNTFNEVECGDFYARSLSSWGLIDALSGYYLNAPINLMEFNPKYKPNNFKSCFVATEGWGSFEQKRTETTQTNYLSVKYGAVSLKTLKLGIPKGKTISEVTIKLGKNIIDAGFKQEDGFIIINLQNKTLIQSNVDLSCFLMFK